MGRCEMNCKCPSCGTVFEPVLMKKKDFIAKLLEMGFKPETGVIDCFVKGNCAVLVNNKVAVFCGITTWATFEEVLAEVEKINNKPEDACK